MMKRTMTRPARPIPTLLAILCGTLLFAAGCDLLDPNPGPDPLTHTGGSLPEPDVDSIPPSVERGAETFISLCARCHGEDGSGTAIWPGSIQGKTGITDIVRHGRRSMPGFPTMSDSLIASIELYLNSFNYDHGTETGQELYAFYCKSCHGENATGTNIYAGSIQGYSPIHTIVREGRGEMLGLNIPDSLIDRIQEYLLQFSIDYSTLTGREYFDRLCASCHGVEGEGTSRGPEIRNPNTGFASYVIRNGRTGHPDYERAMPKYDADSLSSTQLNEIIAWLRSAPKPDDAMSLYNRFCSNCHGRDARGGVTGEAILNENSGEFLEKVREGEGGNNYGRRTSYMPRWSTAELSDAEVSKIAAYVRSLR